MMVVVKVMDTYLHRVIYLIFDKPTDMNFIITIEILCQNDILAIFYMFAP